MTPVVERKELLERCGLSVTEWPGANMFRAVVGGRGDLDSDTRARLGAPVGHVEVSSTGLGRPGLC